MEVLAVINAVIEKTLKEKVEQYAFLEGFLSYELKLHTEKKKIRYRTVMVFEDFQNTVSQYVKNRELEERRLCFGQLLVDRSQHRIILDGEEVKMGPFEFEILLFLLNHPGKAMTRKELNYLLPERKRESGRNIDTHIKNIRKLLHMEDVIKSVRSVGYRIERENFYREMTGEIR